MTKILRPSDVAAWFQEFVAGKEKKRPIPDARQCKEIADYVNAYLAKHEKSPETTKRILEVLRLSEKADAQAAVLLRALQELVEVNTVCLDEHQDKLFKDLTAYLADRPQFWPRPSVEPIPPLLLEHIAEALKVAGRTNVSITAAEGPVLFILARCLAHIYGRPFNVATVSTQLRVQRSALKRLRINL